MANKTNKIDSANITGTATADSINNTGVYPTITSGDGNDTINNSGNYASIDGGNGDDFIVNESTGGYSEIDAGAGNDTIDSRAEYTYVSGGAGNDRISISSSDYNAGTINAGTGNDTITNNSHGVLYLYNEGDGNDVIIGIKEDDTLKIASGTYQTIANGNDVVVKVGTGNITLKNALNIAFALDGTLFGTYQNNTVESAILIGTTNDDTIYNTGDYVSISTGDGNDSIYNYYGYESTIDGGAGNDTIRNYSVRSKVYGGGGNDSIYSDNGYVTIDAGDGNDTIYAYNYYGLTDGGAGNDFINLYSGLSGNTVRGGKGNDTINFTGNYGRLYQYAEGDGNDIIYGFSANDTLQIIGSSHTTLISGNDFIINVGTGSITLKDAVKDPYNKIRIKDTNGNIAVYNDWSLRSGTASSDSIENYVSNVTIDGLAGNDTIRNNSNYVSISGGAGNDSIYNTWSYVTIDAGAGNDKIYSSNSSTVYGGDGDDTIEGYGRIYGGEGNDSIRTSSSSSIDAGDGNDTVINTGSYSEINGGDGNDIISIVSNVWGDATSYYGTINGGKGNDTIYAKNFNDGRIEQRMYQYAEGDGNDVIHGFTAKDILLIAADSYTTTKSGSDVIVSVAGGSITLKDAANKSLNIKTTLRKGTSGADSITNNENYAVIDALAGNDTIKNQANYVTVIAGAGNDSIYNSYSYVTIDAGDGNDTILNNTNYVSINAGAGNDSIYSSNLSTIEGGDGNDTINAYYGLVNGGAGNDFITIRSSYSSTINGGIGNDTIYATVKGTEGRLYQYANGDGNDIIYGFHSNDTFQVTSGNYSTVISGNDFIVNVGTGSVTLKNAITDSYSKVKLMDSAGSMTVYNDWSVMTGTSTNDSLYNYIPNVAVDGLGGNDTINNVAESVEVYGGAGNDSIYNDGYYSTLYGGDGHDTIKNYNGYVKVYGGGGNDSIYSDNGYVTIDAGDGNDTIYAYNYYGLTDGGAGNDFISLYSNSYGNTVRGGKGNDTINFTGNYGHLYQYASGDGNDLIKGISNKDTIQIAGSNYSTQVSGSNVIVKVGSGAMTLEGASGVAFNIVTVQGSTTTDPEPEPETEETVTTSITLTGNNDTYNNTVEGVTISALAGNDTITNTADNVSISGGAGADKITNFGKSATITGGTGNDTISNTGSANTYRYANGDGNDYISGFSESDTLQITSGSISSASLNGNDVVLNIGSGSVILQSYIDREINLLKADGSLESTVISESHTLEGTSKADTLSNENDDYYVLAYGGNDKIANSGNNVSIDAGAGNDSISTQGDNTTISGGTGNDTIINDGGSYNLYQYASGDGNDVIQGFADNDTLHIVSGTISSATVSGDDAILNIGNGSITLKDIVSKTFNLKLGNGNVMSTVISPEETEVSLAVTGTANADKLSNDMDEATILALKGNDTVENYGNNVSISGGENNDRIFNEGGYEVTIMGDAGNDSLISEGDYVFASGGAGNDRITIKSASENATINGGTGNDVISIASGSDKNVIQYGNGDGNDTIYGFTENDTLNITSGTIASASVNGDDWIIKIGNGNIVIKNHADKSIILLDTNGKLDTISPPTDDMPITINGTAKADNINNENDNATINALGGNDTVENAGNSVSISGGVGNDKIINYGNEVTISGGKGNDTIDNQNDSGVIYQYASGDGKDVIMGFTENDTLTITSGSYSAKVSGDNWIVTVGSGSITLKDASDISVNINGTIYTPPPSLPNGWSYSNSTLVTATADATDIDLTENYGANVKRVDGSKTTDGISIIGNSKGNSIKGGKGDDTIYTGIGNDTVNLGSGADVYVYTGGNDIINDYASGDTIQIDTSKISIKSADVSNTNLIFTTNLGKINVKNGASLDAVIVMDDSGNKIYPTVQPIVYPDGWKFTDTTAQATSNSAEDIDLTEDYGEGIKKIDASKLAYGISIIGNHDGNSIKGSKKDDVITGGDGDDTVSLGGGADVYVYTGGDDLIQDYKAGQDIIQIDSGDFDITTVETVGTNLRFTFNDGAGTLTIAKGKSIEVIVIDEDGEQIYPKPIILPYGWKYYDTAKTILQATVDPADDIDLNEVYGATVKKVNAAKLTTGITIQGNDLGNSIVAGKGDDTIIAGEKNDTLKGGNGEDVFVYTGGDDIIQDYVAGQDLIMINSGDVEIEAVDTVKSNVVFTTNLGTITVQKGSGKQITIIDENEDTIYPYAEDTLPAGLTYNSTKTAITADNKLFKDDEINLEEYGGAAENSVTVIDASKLTRGISIVGNRLGNSITAGTGNDCITGGDDNDTLTGGKGNDVFIYTGGDDIITDYGVGADTIQVDNNNVKIEAVEVSGTDLVFTTNLGIFNVQNGKDKDIIVMDDNGNKIYPKVELPDGWKYSNINETLVSATVASADDIDLTEDYGSKVKRVDASKTIYGIEIIGNDEDNSIKGGKGDDTIYGGDGNDTVSLGGGADVYVYTGGNDTILDYAKGKDVIMIDTDNLTIEGIATVSSNVVVTTDQGKLTVKNGKTKSVVFIDSNAEAISFSKSANMAESEYSHWFIEDDNNYIGNTSIDDISSITENNYSAGNIETMNYNALAQDDKTFLTYNDK